MTNADVIRSMNNEELYQFLTAWELGDVDYAVTFCSMCKEGGNSLDLDCDGCRKHWLSDNAELPFGLMYKLNKPMWKGADDE